ncbi:MAG: putative bifunctional diguanylate cyclase/phosphodiesterase [Hormoscilla sp.]
MPQQFEHQGDLFQSGSLLNKSGLEVFNDIIRLANHICNTPLALICLTDEGTDCQQCFPEIPETLRDALARVDLLQWDQLVLGLPYQGEGLVQHLIQFSASTALINSFGRVIGVLSVMDFVDRQLNLSQTEALQALARQVVVRLEQDPTLKASLNQNYTRLAAFWEHHPYPFVACDVRGKVVYVNQAITAIQEQLSIDMLADFLPAEHSTLVQSCLQTGNTIDMVERQVGDRVWSWSYQPLPKMSQVYLYGFEVTAYKREEARLLHNALHDRLTGLPNRALLMEKLQQAVDRDRGRVSGDGCLLALLWLNVDRFKLINDSLGHRSGDRLLQQIAKRLSQATRKGDLIARLAGDNFVMILDRISEAREAIDRAKGIQKLLGDPFHLHNREVKSRSTTFDEVFATVSIGITLSSMGDDEPEHLLRDAEIALYQAKALGRGSCQIFDPAMRSHAVAQLQLENDLRRALDREEFQIYYQPIVARDTGRIAGFEALLRWAHPERGFISPAEFIPVAEETGLIVPLGAWVLRQSCYQLEIWQRQFPSYPPLTLAVNISGKQLSDPSLIDIVDEILQETALEPGSLKLEITESVLMDNAPSAAALLEELRAQNIELCIDDFGTGYSSLSYLQRFPVTTLKIDKSFVYDLTENPENAVIVQAIVGLANNLGMYVTAEGVENDEQFMWLWAWECDYVQGYFFSKPVDRDRATNLLLQAPQW